MRPAAGRLAVAVLDPEDLRHRREADLELLGGRLLGRQVALDLAAGRVEGLGQGLAVVAVAPGEHLDRERGAAEADAGAGDAFGFSTRRSSRTVPPAESSIIGDDQVGAAAVVLFRHRGDVVDALLVGGDRLVLDPVVGGEVAVHQRRPRRARRRSPGPGPRAGPRPARACAAARSSARVAPVAASTRQFSNGMRAPRSRRRASGSTAIASASFSGPRRPGTRATSSGPAPACARRRLRSSRRESRTAAAQWVGPWISRPLRSAIPPSRSRSASFEAMRSTIGDAGSRPGRDEGPEVERPRKRTSVSPLSLLSRPETPSPGLRPVCRLSLALAWKAAH